MTFGERLEQLILLGNTSRQVLSDYLNISVSTLSCYTNDKRRPEYELLVRIAEYFGTSTDYLLGNTSIYCPDSVSDPSENEIILLQLCHQMSLSGQEHLVEQAKLLLRFDGHQDITS